MGHPTIEEFCRVSSPDGMRFEFFRRCQREFRDEVQPRLDERDRLLEENAALKTANAELQDALAASLAPKARPRGPAVPA